MKDVRSCGVWTKGLVYFLIVAVTTLYMPFTGLSSAQAASGPRVYMLGIAQDGDATPLALKGKTEAIYQENFQQSERVQLISNREARSLLEKGGSAPAPAAAGTVGIQGTDEDHTRGLDYLKRAERAFKKSDWNDLNRHANRAIRQFKRAPNKIANFDDVKMAYVYLAAAEAMQNGDPVVPMLTVLAFDRRYEPTGAFEDILIDASDDAHDARHRGSLDIRTTPKDAQVLVNGNAHKAPVSLSKLPAGDYYIRVMAPGYTTYDTVLTLKGGEKLDVVLGGGAPKSAGQAELLNGLRQKAMAQNFDKAFYEDAQTLGKTLKADYIVVGAFKSERRESTFYPLVFHVSSARMGQVTPVEMAHDLSDSDSAISRSYRNVERAMTRDFPDTVLAPGFVLGQTPAVAAQPEPAPERSRRAARAAEPVEERAPAPAAPVAPPMTFGAGQLLLSADDAAKAQEDSTEEESFAEIEKTPVWKAWWFWTIIGVVVVGGGVTAGVMLQPDNLNKPSRLVLP